MNSAEKPNIVFVLADQLCAQSMPIYGVKQLHSKILVYATKTGIVPQVMVINPVAEAIGCQYVRETDNAATWAKPVVSHSSRVYDLKVDVKGSPG